MTPWPHQVRAFDRLYGAWPPRLLIADEVGLGKTIQAGMLLRQAWLAGRARRILILAPKAVLGQWQMELREKFNLNWPDLRRPALVRVLRVAGDGATTSKRSIRRGWHEEPAVIASSQLMRRGDRAAVLLEGAEPWDLVVLDEAHHARRQGAGARWQEDRAERAAPADAEAGDRTAGLLLLTATPLQVHPIEVWDLLALLGLPPEWTADAFVQFFEDAGPGKPVTGGDGAPGGALPVSGGALRGGPEGRGAAPDRTLLRPSRPEGPEGATRRGEYSPPEARG